MSRYSHAAGTSILQNVSGKLTNILGHKILNSAVKCNQEENVTVIKIMEEQNRRLGL
jgi:capsular polysaccharide biosynthesis protein